MLCLGLYIVCLFIALLFMIGAGYRTSYEEWLDREEEAKYWRERGL